MSSTWVEPPDWANRRETWDNTDGLGYGIPPEVLAENVRLLALVRGTEAERDEARADYADTAMLVAQMHAAALGEIRGPLRGVVEDVEDVRLRVERAEAALDRVRALLREMDDFYMQEEQHTSLVNVSGVLDNVERLEAAIEEECRP